MIERLRDAKTASNIPADWWGAVAGYVRHGDPARVWRPADWKRFPHHRKLPIFVRSNPAGRSDGEADAFAAVQDLYDLGVPTGVYVALDSEAAYDRPYFERWCNAMGWCHFLPVHYRSESVMTTQSFAFDWVAWYRNIGPFMAPRPARITQYASGSLWDSSTVRWWTYHFGHWWR